MRFLRGFGRFWYDFIIGEDWRIALGVTLVLAAGALLVAADALSASAISVLVALGIVAVVSASILAGARRSARQREERQSDPVWPQGRFSGGSSDGPRSPSAW